MSSNAHKLQQKDKLALLGLSGSMRAASTNTALLRCLATISEPQFDFRLDTLISQLPIFSPDLESEYPESVLQFIAQIKAADALVIASPEYMHAIPGGLKNALDWLVSGEVIIDKPIVLVHASHRGGDMLAQLRLVLTTISTQFNTEIFFREPLMSQSPEEVGKTMANEQVKQRVQVYFDQLQRFINSY